ncbi:MAG: pilus assembly protein [Polyangiaceae bacterium]|nr:pilus assembly protein [Polyangiaceae bacterium]
MKTRDQYIHSRKKTRRSAARGAAMVEAAVVLPVMLLFYGLIGLTYRMYEAKMDKQMGTRAGILYYASHNCKGNIPPELLPTQLQGLNPTQQSSDTGAGSALSQGSSSTSSKVAGSNTNLQDGVSGQWSLATADLPKQNLPAQRWRYSTVYKKGATNFLPYVSAYSQVACNPERHDGNQLMAMWDFVRGTFSSRGSSLL